MRLRVALALLAGVLLVTACSLTRGSGQLATESREVSGFAKVELSGTGELTIKKTGTESLTISAEDNLLPRLTSEVSNGTLILGAKPNTSILPTKPITYSVTVKELTGRAVSGSGGIQAPNHDTCTQYQDQRLGHDHHKWHCQ
jgi:hypothetical protein